MKSTTSSCLFHHGVIGVFDFLNAVVLLIGCVMRILWAVFMAFFISHFVILLFSTV
ncbi:hypothetical protein F5884DRAFT_784291 [Xylogone sp. PMI_703]|nr:hypothetical protein F5884DRAFT_784291 [Xylogone sp. PMI_703]